MSNIPATKPTVTLQGTAAQQATRALPEEYVPLSPELLLLFCQSRLQEMDTAIQKKMTNQQGIVGLQEKMTSLQQFLKAGDGLVNGDTNVAYDNAKVMGEADGKINELIDLAKAAGNPQLVQQLQAVQTKLHTAGDVMVTFEEVKEMTAMIDNSLSSCRTGAELNMIDLQSLVSKRATMLQLTTGMMNSIDEGRKAIAANIGR